MSTVAEMRRVGHWIGGAAASSRSSATGLVSDSATGEDVAEVDLADVATVEAAVAAAAASAPGWATTSLGRRADIMFRFREALVRDRDDLVALVSREHGKTIADARGEFARGLEVVDFACGIPHLLKGEASANVGTGIDSTSLRLPLGVTAAITPFNFPIMVPLWLVPIALACGNAMVLKPSEQTPSAALRLGEILQGAGLPDGVFNVVNGDRNAVDALLAHPSISAVSFVGSTPVARHIYEMGAAHGKRVQALGGAKNHAVVMPDADLAGAVNGLISAAYGSSGQRCMAVSVAVAVGDFADALVAELAEATRSLRPGPFTDTEADLGPLISRRHADSVRAAVDRGVEEGAALVVDGRDVEVPGHPDGHWLGPCLFDHVTTDMDIYTREIFGPVLVVVRVESYDEALALVNANPYGNGAVIYTRAGATARHFELSVTAGLVGVNVPIPVPVAYHAFGGWKASLFGDTHVYGPEGVRFNTRGKVITRRWSDGPAARDMNFPASDSSR